jgi:hypothetical protein
VGRSLSWDEEQERLTLEARLLASSPEAVFEELKKRGAKIRAQEGLWTGDAKYEVSLIGRNERLINLGLASYGTNEEVLKALYKHGLEPAQDASEASYKEGLRIGLLSNNTAHSARFFFRFPDEIIGPEEIRRVLNEASDNEAVALIQNPKVSDNLLEELYKRQGPFVDTPAERWLKLIYLSASNARLGTEHEYPDSPDMGHYSIHKSIFELLETARSTTTGSARSIIYSGIWIFGTSMWQSVSTTFSGAGRISQPRKRRTVSRKAISQRCPSGTNSGAS